MRTIFLLFNTILLAIGNCGGPLLLRLYFLRGGARLWFSTWLQTAAWPVVFIPLLISYLRRRRRRSDVDSNTKFFLMTPCLFISGALIGLLVGLMNYLYTYGVAKLPVSTSSLIVSSQLAFTALFAFFLVKQHFTAFSVNSIVLLTAGAVVLGLRAGNDRPAGESNKEYGLGFVLTLGSAALYGLIMPLVELIYNKANTPIGYILVLEFQMVVSLAATLFCSVGMFINHDFQVIPREAREFELGAAKYYILVICSGIIFQFFLIGALGVICYGSSLLSVVINTVLLPVTELLAVILFHEKFQPEKGVSLFLCLWGFVSYFYGEMKRNKDMEEKEKNQTPQTTEMTPTSHVA
ncbi:PREDICTED: purine permease 3-like [Ipomoea nil]|uniref:purine permease 3-like n=1 Tax=Ipomoea nil TaxID=35883 RepID=UPI000900CBB8|nr:PREDICTED: purine permease 3-like [Ipomoea nil]